MSYLELPTLDVKNKKQKKSFEIFRRIMRFQFLNHKLNITVEKLEATFRKRLRKKKKKRNNQDLQDFLPPVKLETRYCIILTYTVY